MADVSRVAITIPKIGLTAEEVTLEQWTKQVGERVSAGDAIAELTTDKATVELEAPADGVLAEIVVGAHGTAAVGAVVGYLDTPEGG